MAEQRGRPRNRPGQTIQASVSMPEELHAQLKEVAAREGRSLSNLIVRALNQWRKGKEVTP